MSLLRRDITQIRKTKRYGNALKIKVTVQVNVTNIYKHIKCLFRFVQPFHVKKIKKRMV